MTLVARALQALGLPQEALIEQRVPKKLLMEQAPSSGDRRLIQDGLEELTWYAALKPSNVGILSFEDETREYLEVAILSAHLRPEARGTRLTELIHRAIPYPVFLLTAQEDDTRASLAHLRRAQSGTSPTILEDKALSVSLPPDGPLLDQTLQSLALSQQPTLNLYALYQGWMETLEALDIAHLSGHFIRPDSPANAQKRRQQFLECQMLDTTLTRLRAEARREAQLNRRVDLNLEIRQLDARRKSLIAQLNQIPNP